MTKHIWAAMVAATAIWAAPAGAQELHAGDVELGAADGKIILIGAAHEEAGTGRDIFEGDWPGTSLISLRRYAVDEPGFDSSPGTFLPDTEITLSGWGSLAFWDGDSWESTMPKGETVGVSKFFDSFSFSGAGVAGDPLFIGAAGADGVVHEHVVFMLAASPANTEPSVGAYRIGLQLSSPTLQTSDEFYIVFNRGLSAEAFEESIHAMAVPEPGTWATMGLGLALMAGLAARRRRS